MPLPSPKPFFDLFVGERRHRESRVRNAKPSLFVSHNSSCGINGAALGLRGGECACMFYAVLEDQLMNFTHKCIERMIPHKSKWDSTDAAY